MEYISRHVQIKKKKKIFWISGLSSFLSFEHLWEYVENYVVVCKSRMGKEIHGSPSWAIIRDSDRKNNVVLLEIGHFWV